MADNYAIKRYHRQNVTVIGTNRKMKYVKILAVLLVAGILGIAYLVYSSGILAEDNPRIVPQLAGRINLERYANNLAPVNVDPSLSYFAYTKSQEVKVSQMNYAQGSNANPDDATDVFIIPKITWALSSNDFQQQIIDSRENRDSSFRKHMLDPNYRTIGIGLTSDSYNYYIVTKWKNA